MMSLLFIIIIIIIVVFVMQMLFYFLIKFNLKHGNILFTEEMQTAESVLIS